MIVDLAKFNPDSASSEEIFQAQRQLSAEGLYRDEIDGLFGKKSRAALNAWRSANMLPAAPVQLPSVSNALRGEYLSLFETAKIKKEHEHEVKVLAAVIAANKGTYKKVEEKSKVPWWVVALLHAMEGGLNFNTHLANGDSLKARTVHVPRGIPREGRPPFTWEEAALAALREDKVDRWSDWTLPGAFYKIEAFNGMGTRRRGIHTPYLWSYTQHYAKGKYVEDDVWDPDAVSKQAGAAAILRVLMDNEVVKFNKDGTIS